ncbi:DUF4142 domain-containing protein [Consotaella salsifontis]|uniref:Putative membrane protein n=1 Tax=Consotaella salsifontis TaxID=1365950 RepID=A0A1T4QYI7_9HYPH|nr:DUF4142 domain-containing protein [Consotaella salsifontis]SKA08666.1 putative membrane protein [Consotaella salsifontis]
MIRSTLVAVATGLALASMSGSAFAKTDKAFITDAIKGDNSEMTLGKMAARMGTSDGIRSFGRTLETDHGKAKKDAVTVAKKLGVKPPSEMSDEAKKEQAKLQGMSGEDFDEEFARYMVKDHKKDIAEFEAKAKDGKDATSTLAEKTLPALRKHLRMAQKLDKEM